MTICRQPFWWETWWARLFFILLAVILLWGLRTLRRRILMLYELQKKRKEIVLTEIELNPDELRASKIDGQFLQRAVLLVEKNIRDVNYNVARFSNDMCMSRMNLYRKLHMLTGLSPSEFMRDIRLKKAAQMILSRPTVPINEIAAKVGFSTPGYFTKCFKEMFGVLPTQYGKSKQ
jgi:AraC-like DNA-binding protein